MRKRLDYNLPPWEELVRFSADSPTGLVWAEDRVNCSYTRKAVKGSPAGGKSALGYWVIPYKKKYYKCHRVVWMLTHGGSIDNNLDVDHIDRDRGNNTLSNLRLVEEISNRRNRCKFKSNTSGFTGVKWWESKAKNCSSLYAVAQWQSADRQKKTKNFSVKKYGLLPAFKMACEYRIKMIEELNQQGAGYTENHGK